MGRYTVHTPDGPKRKVIYGRRYKEVEKKLGAMSKLQELARSAEERIAALNTLSEHVTQKAKSLEGQKHTIDRAVVEANRLNEMVWSMGAVGIGWSPLWCRPAST